MKFSAVLVAAFAGLAAAQSACVLQCSTEAASTAGCSSITDTTCVCTNDAFQSAARECLTTQCTAAEQQEALQLQQQLCGAASGSSTATASEPTETDTQSPTDTVSEPDTSTDGLTSTPATVSRSLTTTSPAISTPAVTTPRTTAPLTRSSTSAATAVSPSLTTSQSSKPNSAVGAPVFNFAATGVWTAVALGGVAIAQLVL